MSDKSKFEELVRASCRCRYCFDNFGLTAPTIAIAQPRWVGSHYWNCRERILVVLLNPGSGEGRYDDADEQMYQKLIAFRDEQGVSLEQIFSDQVADMQNWGRGRFWRYFITSIGLNIDEIAFANIAWCATAGNNYPIQMLSQCYEKFTSRLLEALSPDVILLSGSNVHSFSNRVQTILPNAKLFPILHYAHREGMQLEKREVKRIQELLRTVSG